MPLCLSEFDGAYNEAWPQQIRQNAAIFCDWLVAEFEAVIVYFLQAFLLDRLRAPLTACYVFFGAALIVLTYGVL